MECVRGGGWEKIFERGEDVNFMERAGKFINREVIEELSGTRIRDGLDCGNFLVIGSFSYNFQALITLLRLSKLNNNENHYLTSTNEEEQMYRFSSVS